MNARLILTGSKQRGHDGGLCVDGTMRVVRSATGGGRRAESNIFAAGDCCCLEWPKRESDHWFQLRLWRQARAAGLYAAQCMADSVDELGPGGAFDLFVHATQFFGFQVRPAQKGKRNSVFATHPIREMGSPCTNTPRDYNLTRRRQTWNTWKEKLAIMSPEGK